MNCRHQANTSLEVYFSTCKQFCFTLKTYTGINESADKPASLSYLHFIYFYEYERFLHVLGGIYVGGREGGRTKISRRGGKEEKEDEKRRR